MWHWLRKMKGRVAGLTLAGQVPVQPSARWVMYRVWTSSITGCPYFLHRVLSHMFCNECVYRLYVLYVLSLCAVCACMRVLVLQLCVGAAGVPGHTGV